MSVLNQYSKEDLETALIIAWMVRDNINLAIKQADVCGTLKYGICSEWDDLLDGWDRKVTIVCIRDDLYRQWPSYSGSCWYPIPMPESYEDEYCCYAVREDEEEDDGARPRAEWMYERTANMWEGEYGSLRMDCLDYLIYTLEKAVL